ncbi:oligopeptide/dipeptide ABC transporter ATP-binding protein [Nocardioides sp. AE5]|uniref:ABC transporter ATP-binding protein n=1 Tax=Nocardioides sp. AE5 TaxID=2962573 RepID=UPI002880C34C|nr:oligopeptide/dipeptide ABC transporter ATP-binding protein [Nocardioides sp. AE5]MDT0203183.1 ATP-binding cassette domain-containing protein [Nocardioides sp. AE5]
MERLEVQHRVGPRKVLRAVSDLSFDIARGETLGVVGESGCGKSSAAMAIMQLAEQTGGSISIEGRDLPGLSAANLRRARQQMQIVFQSPQASLNPRRRVRDLIGEGLRIWEGKVDPDRVNELMLAVGLDPEMADRRPGELSGGQCQRVSIARALAVQPTLLVCDEPVSALDVSVQAQVLNLLKDLRDELGLSMLFISHDLGVVNYISDRVLVLYLGKSCEIAGTRSLFNRPRHPYTHTLMAALPGAKERGLKSHAQVGVEMPSPIDPPSGCRFHTRCLLATERCRTEEPALAEVEADHWVACHHPIDPDLALTDPEVTLTDTNRQEEEQCV